MPPSTVSKDLPDNLVDAQIRILRNDLEAEVETRVQVLLKAEKSRIASHVKIVSGAFVIVGAMTTFLGYREWADVQKRIDKQVGERLDKHLKESPPARFSSEIEALYNKSLVYIAAQQIPGAGRVRSPLAEHDNVPTDHWPRILAALTDERSSEQTRATVLRVLKHSVGSFVAVDLGTIREAAFSVAQPQWMTPSRQATLIDALTIARDQSAAPSVVKLLSRTSASEVIIASLAYVQELYVVSAKSHVEALATDTLGERVNSASLATLASISPSSTPLVDFMGRMADSQGALSPIDVAKAMRCITSVAPIGLDFDEHEKRKKLAAEWLEQGLDWPIRLTAEVGHPQIWVSDPGSVIENQFATFPADHTSLMAFNDALTVLVRRVVKRKNYEEFAKLVSLFSVSERFPRDSPAMLLNVRFFTGEIELADATLLDDKASVDGVWFLPPRLHRMSGLSSDDELLPVVVAWLDRAGNMRQGKLASMGNLDLFAAFDLASVPEWLTPRLR